MIDTELELVLIEELWNAPHCESRHLVVPHVKCSHIPVSIYSVRCESKTLNICANAVKYVLAVWDRGNNCTCGSLASQCWSVTPLPAS